MEQMPSVQQRGLREDAIDFTLMTHRIVADMDRLLLAYEVILSRFPSSVQKRLAERYMREARAIIARLGWQKVPCDMVDEDRVWAPLSEAEVNKIRWLTAEIEQSTVTIRNTLGAMLETRKETGKERNLF